VGRGLRLRERASLHSLGGVARQPSAFRRHLRQLFLLPGLDGTGRLLAPFLRDAPEGVKAAVVPLPHRSGDYRGLIEYLLRELDLQPRTILVAESFSGPVALALAARRPVAGVVLCNSFVLPPAPRLLRTLVHPALFRPRPPAWLVQRYLLNGTAIPDLVAAVRDAIHSVEPPVLAARLRAVLTVDAVPDLRRSQQRILYLRASADRLVPAASVAQLTALAPVPVQVVEIQGPHLLLQAAPTASWTAIAAFLRDLDAA
jgi:pimeloyl-[acyl-carrier protein] methyl ester esterase